MATRDDFVNQLMTDGNKENDAQAAAIKADAAGDNNDDDDGNSSDSNNPDRPVMPPNKQGVPSNLPDPNAQEYASRLRALKGITYEDAGKCANSLLNPLREMGYDIPISTADDIAKGKIKGITPLPDIDEDRQGTPGIINAYDWLLDGKIDHVNAGVGQLKGEIKPQVIDATENDADGKNEKWTTNRNQDVPTNGQTQNATAGLVNQTFTPFSNSTKPVLQLKIDFNELGKYYY